MVSRGTPTLTGPGSGTYGARRFCFFLRPERLGYGVSAMSDGHRPQDDLKSLRERVDKMRRDRPQETASGGGSDRGAFNSALSAGLRIGLELVVAVAFCVGLGWLIDQGLGTRPWAMLAGVILGF